MNYLPRDMERKFLKMSSAFKAVLLTGARQVGKTTMLRHLAEGSGRNYVSMDNLQYRELAQNDPKLFFQVFPPPVLIDEVQKAPALFETIKILCDESEEKGLFWLTGSESKKLLREAGDSLAGRICVLRMYGLSQHEKQGICALPDFDFTMPALIQRQEMISPIELPELFSEIWRGGMPGTRGMDAETLREYYASYIDTYLVRDAVDDNGVTNPAGFCRLLRACAAFTGNLLNYSDLAASAGVSVMTAKSWVQVLENMGVVALLEPFSNNALKRLVKTPKLYFCDTGLAAYLSSWSDRNVLMNGAAAGHYFENYVIGEFLRMKAASAFPMSLSFYRDSNQKEIDLVVDVNGIRHPLEIKMSAAPARDVVHSFNLLPERGTGAVVCMTDRVFPLDRENLLVPAGIL